MASQPDTISRWAEQVSDRLNPILVKETRQALKSKQFLATFAIMLFGGWLISAFVLMALVGGNDDSPYGKNVFPFYFGLLAFTVMLVVPFGAFRSLLAERDLNTYELLNITTLSPQQIVWGKWLSAQVQTFIYFSAISPFVAFSYLLRGVDFPTLIFVLILAMFASMMLSLLSLTFSTFARQRQAQVVLSLVLLGQLVWVMGAGISLGTYFVAEEIIDFSEPEIYWGGLVIATYYIGTFVLCLQIARAQLTFESDNRSTGIRLSSSALYWLTLGWLGVGLYQAIFSGTPPGATLMIEPVYVVLSFLGVFWGAVCLFAATETDGLSRRIRSQLPKNFLLRFLAVPFLPGGGRGMLMAVLHLVALVGLAFAVGQLIHDPKWVHISKFTVGLSCYIVFYAGMSAALGRWLRKATPLFRPAQTRAFAIVMFALSWLAPNIANIFRNSRSVANPLFYLSDPINTLETLDNNLAWADEVMTALLVMGGVALLLNIHTMWRGFTEVVFLREPAADETALFPQSQLADAPTASAGMLDTAATPEPSTTS